MPDGYSPEVDLLRDVRESRAKVRNLKEKFRHAYEASFEWRERAIESYRFTSGQQWDDADLEKLKRERRPALVINKILSPVLFLGGVQRQQRTEIKLLGFERSDFQKAELMQSLIKWVSQQSREQEIDSKVFLDKIITGLGFWKLGVDFDYSPDGQIKWERVSPLAIFADPNWFDGGWKAAKYVFHALWRELDELIDEYPEHEQEIRSQYGEWLSGDGRLSGVSSATARGEEAGDSFATRRMFWDPETQRARVLEAWYATRMTVDVAYDSQSGRVETDEQAIAGIQQAQLALPGQAGQWQMLSRPVKRVFKASLLNDLLLDDGPSPYKEQCFPIFPALGHHFWEHPFGIVDVMKDPQREINRRRSSVIEIVRRMPHAGWMNHKTMGAKTEELETYAKGSGFVVNFESQIPTQIKPPDLPQTLVYLERANANEIRDVVNINAELTGNTTQRTVSGRAIEARQRGGLTVQEPLLESFDNEKADAVLFVVALIQQFVPVSKAMRVLGTLAQRDPDSPVNGMFAQLDQLGVAAMLSDAFNTKFDILVKSQPFHPSVQAERWDTLVELAQTFGPQIPPDIMVEAATDAQVIDEATGQKILQRIQQQQQMTALAAAGHGGMPPGGPPPVPVGAGA